MIPCGMKQDDARKLDHATLEAMRIRAVRSVQACGFLRLRTVIPIHRGQHSDVQSLCRKGYPHFSRALHGLNVAVAKVPGSACAAGIVAL